MVQKLRWHNWGKPVSSFLCLIVLLQSFAVGWAQSAAAPGFPVPSDPNQIFFLQRSMNSNTIVYTARLDARQKLDRREPIEIFWRRFNDSGEKLPITFAERHLAFGVRAKPVKNLQDAYLVSLVAYTARSAILRIVNGKPQLEGKVAGQDARLVSAYLHLDESGRIPRVVKVDLRGEALANGQPLVESFIP